jgi:hypothetical protein
MSSVTLPPLPSARAKEIESRRQEKLSAVNSQNDTEKISLVQKEEDKKTAKSTNDALFVDEQNKIVQKSVSYTEINERRTKQLQALHQKEEKVFGTLPPLESNLTCEAIHQYISTTSAFLNSYVADVNASLEGTSHKLSVLERQMGILEGRLGSIAGLMEEEDGAEGEKE